MKCPIISQAIRREYGNDPLKGCECLKADCAWWLDNASMCCVRDFALELSYTQSLLQDMAQGLRR